jgi:hypothetical protein
MIAPAARIAAAQSVFRPAWQPEVAGISLHLGDLTLDDRADAIVKKAHSDPLEGRRS